VIAPIANINWNGAQPPPANMCASTAITPYSGFSQIILPTTAYGLTTSTINSVGNNGYKTCGMRYSCSNGSFVDVSGTNNCSCSNGSVLNSTTLLCECPAGFSGATCSTPIPATPNSCATDPAFANR
jgi:hypothetical protein